MGCAMSVAPHALSVYLSDVSSSDASWDSHRSDSYALTQLYAGAVDFERYAERMHLCAGFLQFGFRQNPNENQSHIQLKHALFCRVRYCAVCQWRRSMLWRAKFFQMMPDLTAQHDTARWIFVTLTVRNCPITDLRDTLGDMSQAWRRLVMRDALKKSLLGFVRSTEVTRGKDGSAHPHYHALLLVKPSYFSKNYIKQSAWRDLWRDAMRIDYDPIVNIKPVKGDVQKAVLETLKYSTKPSDMIGDPDWFLELTRQTHKLRFIATGGVLKNCLKSEDEITAQDLIAAGENPDPDDDGRRITFVFNRREQRFKYAPMLDVDPAEKTPPSEQLKKRLRLFYAIKHLTLSER